MQVKVSSPEMCNIAQGEGFHSLQASTAARVNGKERSGAVGSKSMAGNPTVHIGAWENHVVPDGSFQQAEEARRSAATIILTVPVASATNVAITRTNIQTGPYLAELVSMVR